MHAFVSEMCIRLSLSLRKQLTFGDTTTGFPAKQCLRNECRNSLLMTHHYPDLGGASDWSCCVGNKIQPNRKIHTEAQENSQVTFIWEIWWPLQEAGRFVPNLGNSSTDYCMPNLFCTSVNETRNCSQVYSEKMYSSLHIIVTVIQRNNIVNFPQHTENIA